MRMLSRSWALAVAALALGFGAVARIWLLAGTREVEGELRKTRGELEQCLPFAGGLPVSKVGFHSGFASGSDSARWVQIDLGRDTLIDSVSVVPACLNGQVAYGFPRKFRIETAIDPVFGEPELLVETEVEDPTSVLPLFFAAGERWARFVRFTAVSLVPQPSSEGRFIFCLGEFLVFGGGRNVALGCPVMASKTVETLPTWSPKHLVDGSCALGAPVRPGPVASNGWHSSIFTRPDAVSFVQVDLGVPRRLDEIWLIPAHPRDYPERSGFGFPVRFRVEVDLSGDFVEPRVVFDGSSGDLVNPGDAKVAFASGGVSGRFIRVTALKLWERSRDFVFALSELEAFEGSENVTRNARVTASDSTETARWAPRFLVDGLAAAGTLIGEKDWIEGLSKRRVLEGRLEKLLKRQSEEVRAFQARLRVLGVGAVAAALGGAGLLAWRGRFVRAREVEVLRQQISRDLHDQIGSNLCSIRLVAEMGAGPGPGGSEQDALLEIRELAEASTESLRDMVWLLKEGGQPQIRVLVEKMRAVAELLLLKIRWDFRVHGVPRGAVAPLSFHRDLLLIFREALHNVAKHSGAPSVDIEFEWTDGEVILSVADTGCGFGPAGKPSGDGLENMRYRAAQLQGVLLFESRRDGGTRVLLKVPIP